jgi:hypothetical protein
VSRTSRGAIRQNYPIFWYTDSLPAVTSKRFYLCVPQLRLESHGVPGRARAPAAAVTRYAGRLGVSNVVPFGTLYVLNGPVARNLYDDWN